MMRTMVSRCEHPTRSGVHDPCPCPCPCRSAIMCLPRPHTLPLPRARASLSTRPPPDAAPAPPARRSCTCACGRGRRGGPRNRMMAVSIGVCWPRWPPDRQGEALLKAPRSRRPGLHLITRHPMLLLTHSTSPPHTHPAPSPSFLLKSSPSIKSKKATDELRPP